MQKQATFADFWEVAHFEASFNNDAPKIELRHLVTVYLAGLSLGDDTVDRPTTILVKARMRRMCLDYPQLFGDCVDWWLEHFAQIFYEKIRLFSDEKQSEALNKLSFALQQEIRHQINHWTSEFIQ